MNRMRLGIVATHPIQYQIPLYRYLAAHSCVEPIVFFMSEHGLTESFDPGFGRLVKYDVPMLGGYDHRLVRNRSPKPSPSTALGVVNPSLPVRIWSARLDALLVHGYSGVSHWLAYAAAISAGIPYLLRGESRPDAADLGTVKRVAKHALIRPLVRRADACLAIGEENHRFYRFYGAASDRIFFAPYSVDNDRFYETGAAGRSARPSMLRALGLDPKTPLVLFAAKLQPWKRPIDVVLAMDQLAPPANLIVIGDGPLRPYMEALAHERPWMRMLGFVNQAKIAEWYGAADLFVLPSDCEPWGLAVNEAMAAGAVPIVSRAVGCWRDLVRCEVGWVYPTGNIDALTAVIREGCRPGALSGRRVAAQRRAADYGIAATADGIEAAVASVLGR